MLLSSSLYNLGFKINFICLTISLSILNAQGINGPSSTSSLDLPWWRLQPPGLNYPSKAWWAKEVAPGLHVAGRLSPRQIKYAAEAGFKSVLSLFTYPGGDPPGSFGGDYLPVTPDEKKIVEEDAGLQFISLLDPMDEWSSVEAIEKFTAVMPSLKKPALLHCDRGYTIAYVILLYMVNQTRHDPTFEPKIRQKEFFEITASMGLDFLQRIPLEVLEDVSGEKTPHPKDPSIPRANFEPEDWLDYWCAHPVYKNWYIAGQIAQSHLPPLEEFGYKSVVNIRESFGEVNRLNVRDDTRKSSKQSDSETLITLIDSKKPFSYVSPTSKQNYESTNPHEFGDDKGFYNEKLEKAAFEKSNLKYHHMPCDDGSMDDFGAWFEQHAARLQTVGEQGAVLVHCRTGLSAGIVATLAAAEQHRLSLSWALGRLREMGTPLSPHIHPHIYKVYSERLKENLREEL